MAIRIVGAPEAQGRGPRVRASDGLLALTVLFSVMALGSVQVWALAVLGVLSALSAVLAIRAGRPVPGVRPLVLVLLGFGVLSVLQIVPLPLALLEAIASDNADVWRRARELIGDDPDAWAPISLHPKATVVEVLKLCTYANVAIASAAVGRRWGTRTIAAATLAAGVALALVTFGHGIVGAERVFGIHRPSIGTSSWHLGPLLNPNNLHGYLNVALFAGAGLLPLRLSREKRAALLVGVAITLAGALVAASRAGLMGFACGFVTYVVLMALVRRRLREGALVSRRSFRAQVAVVVVFAAVGAAVLGTRASFGEATETDLGKLDTLSQMLPMLAEHPWVGIGRGAFETVSPAYVVGQGSIVFSHAENFLVQWAADWGLPVCVVALVVLGFAVRPSALGVSRRPPAVGVAAGAVALLAQNLFDLGLEVPAVVTLLVFALSGCLGAAARGTSALGRPFVWAGAVVTAGLAIAIGVGGVRSVGAAREAMEVEVGRSSVDVAALRPRIEAAVRSHPADPYFYRAGAVVAWRSGDPHPLRWVGRALERGPKVGRSHYLLGVMLGARGATSQALAALRRSVELDHGLAARAARRAASLSRDADALLGAVPDGPVGTEMLVTMGRALPADAVTVRERLLREAMKRGTSAPLVSLLLDALERESAPCGAVRRKACIAELERILDGMDDVGTVLERGRLHLLLDQAEAAERLLAERCFELAKRDRCLRLRVKAAAALGNRHRFRAAASALAAAGCPGDGCAVTLQWIGDRARDAGHPATALDYHERAASESRTVGAWLRAARSAVDAADRPRAERALRRATVLARSAKDRRAIDRVRASISRGNDLGRLSGVEEGGATRPP